MEQKVINVIKELIADILESQEEISEDARLVEDLGIDSVLILQLIVNIEMQFNITFDDEDLLVDKFSSISSLADYITELMEK